ncbi:MAG: DUF417 family protein [Bacteroidetes bacterium]|jgi:uncharacterized membrane protein YkgB|nr:DUF417 family protein [Bacteroidota bacterium]
MNLKKTGYALGVTGTSLVLLWIGILKFTPSEAMGIKPYVEHSFLMNWMYAIGSVRQVSDVIGIFETATSVLLLASFWNSRAGLIAGYLSAIIFLTTLSFLFTTPGIWKAMDGVPVTDFFVLKDLGFLAVGLQVIGSNSETKKSNPMTVYSK